MKMLDRLPRQVLLGSAPLLVWALHFTLCYGLVAAQCSPALSQPPQRWLLIAISLAALGLCGALLWRAPRAWSVDARLMDWARAGGALLAMAGIAWTSLPLLLLDGCG